MAGVYLPSWDSTMSVISSKPMDLDLVSGMGMFLQLDGIFCFAAAFGWLVLLVSDMKEAELTEVGWGRLILCAGLGTLITGPGALVTIAWLWREEILVIKDERSCCGRECYGTF